MDKKEYPRTFEELFRGSGIEPTVDADGTTHYNFKAMKKEEDYILVPCPCSCHRNPGMKHIVACCDGGFIKVPKGVPKLEDNHEFINKTRKMKEDLGFDPDATLPFEDMKYIPAPMISMKTDAELYFTPSIEDIRVGYEAEANIKFFGDKKDNWQPFVFQGIGQEVIEYHKKGVYRVPYLTKEQIEKEGWKNTTRWFDETKKQSLANFPNFTFETKTGSLRIYLKDLNDPSKGLSIEEYRKSTGEAFSMSSFFNRYNGECKDINTFRYICKLLGI